MYIFSFYHLIVEGSTSLQNVGNKNTILQETSSLETRKKKNTKRMKKLKAERIHMKKGKVGIE